jgi:hypothetical protein
MPAPEIEELVAKLDGHQREPSAQVRALSDEQLREHPRGTEWPANRRRQSRVDRSSSHPFSGRY